MDAARTQHATGSPEQQRREPAFRIHDILKNNAAAFVAAHPSAAVRQVQSTLAKISVCSTAALGASWQLCAQCEIGTTRLTFNTLRSKSAATQPPATHSPLDGVVMLRGATGRMIALMITGSTIAGSVITKFAPSVLTIVPPADKISLKANSAASLKSQGRNQTV